jgi:hypothetical protein
MGSAIPKPWRKLRMFDIRYPLFSIKYFGMPIPCAMKVNVKTH